MDRVRLINALFSLGVRLQAMNGFLMMMTQNGKLLYISDNAAEYLGHSMVSFRRRSARPRDPGEREYNARLGDSALMRA